ncbi:MAG: hypothetical protein AB1646_22545, partial [Thermodesulfobacteriota bacterium]
RVSHSPLIISNGTSFVLSETVPVYSAFKNLIMVSAVFKARHYSTRETRGFLFVFSVLSASLR